MGVVECDLAHNRKGNFVNGFRKLPSQSNKCVGKLEQCFPKFLLADRFLLRKISADSHILPHIIIVSGG